MSVVNRFKKKLIELEKAINPTIEKTVNSKKPLIIDQQTNEQLYEGKDANDKNLQPSYALSTKIVKRKKGQPTDRVTLKDTGDLYRSVSVDAKTNEFIISANTEYYKFLVNHYSSNIYVAHGNQKIFQESCLFHCQILCFPQISQWNHP